jgi:V/A-type H+-transporting ATPase subunit I
MFFTVFFAMIIGDAGYGILLFILSSFITIRQKRRGAVSDGLILLNLLSFATIVWGGITGNWFGFEPISKLPGFRDIIIPSLNTYTDGSADAVKFLCFVIGTVHIVLAHTIQFVKKIREKPYIHAFGQIGWMTTILGLYYLVLSVVISSAEYPIPNFALPMIGIGMGFVFIFDNQEGDGFFRGVIRSLANIIPTALSGVSSFSDIISYIRLYAVGLSGFAIAQSFNSMAKGIMETGAIGIAAGIVVVLLGHTLNLAMAGLSVVVHGVRLNMLEFSNHVGNEWAGFAYKPFGEQTQ